MDMMLYPDTMILRLPQRFLPAFDVGGQPSPLTPVDARSPVNARPCHYAMACNFSKREGTSIMTTHQSILHKFDGLILYPLTYLSTYSG
jgi:hypothetical protein